MIIGSEPKRSALGSRVELVTPPLAVDSFCETSVSSSRSLRANATVVFATVLAIDQGTVPDGRSCFRSGGPHRDVLECNVRIVLKQSVTDLYVVAKEVWFRFDTIGTRPLTHSTGLKHYTTAAEARFEYHISF